MFWPRRPRADFEGTIGGSPGWSTVDSGGGEVVAVATGESDGSAMPHSTENIDVAKSAKAGREYFVGDGRTGQMQALVTLRWRRQMKKPRTHFSYNPTHMRANCSNCE